MHAPPKPLILCRGGMMAIDILQQRYKAELGALQQGGGTGVQRGALQQGGGTGAQQGALQQGGGTGAQPGTAAGGLPGGGAGAPLAGGTGALLAALQGAGAGCRGAARPRCWLRCWAAAPP